MLINCYSLLSRRILRSPRGTSKHWQDWLSRAADSSMLRVETAMLDAVSAKEISGQLQELIEKTRARD